MLAPIRFEVLVYEVVNAIFSTRENAAFMYFLLSGTLH